MTHDGQRHGTPERTAQKCSILFRASFLCSCSEFCVLCSVQGKLSWIFGKWLNAVSCSTKLNKLTKKLSF